MTRRRGHGETLLDKYLEERKLMMEREEKERIERQERAKSAQGAASV